MAVTWSFSNGVLTLSGTGDTGDFIQYNPGAENVDYIKDLIVPWYAHLDDIEEVVVGEGITRIGDYIFYGSHLGTDGFLVYVPLESVTLPTTLLTIGKRAFATCVNIQQITLPEGLQYIDDGAFSECIGLESLRIPESVTTVGAEALYGVRTVILGGSFSALSIKSFVDSFAGSFVLTELVLEEGSPYTKGSYGEIFNADQTELLMFMPDVTGDYSVPNTVTDIREYCFYWSRLSSITLNNGLSIIHDYAFHKAKSITSITIPYSVVEIQSFAFSECTALAAVTFDDNSQLIACSNIGSGAFRYTALTEFQMPPFLVTLGENFMPGYETSPIFEETGITTLTIPRSVISIGIGALDNVALTSITVDENNRDYCDIDGILYSKDMTVLIKCPERKAQTMWSYVMPDSVVRVEQNAFLNNMLGQLTLSKNLTTIGAGAFLSVDPYGDGTLEGADLVIPAKVSTIGYKAFAHCYKINSLTIKAKVPPALNNAFPGAWFTWWEDAPDQMNFDTITIPYRCTEAYEAAEGWSAFAGRYVEAASVFDAVSFQLGLAVGLGLKGWYRAAKPVYETLYETEVTATEPDLSNGYFAQQSYLTTTLPWPLFSGNDTIRLTINGTPFVYTAQTGKAGYTNFYYIGNVWLKSRPEDTTVEDDGGDYYVSTQLGLSHLVYFYFRTAGTYTVKIEREVQA